MEAEKTYQNKLPRTIQQKRAGEGAMEFTDNRQSGILQTAAAPVQREEDEDEATAQAKFEEPVQRHDDKEDEEPLQGKFEQPIQREENRKMHKEKNETGIPDKLKERVEKVTGISYEGVRVYYNSDKPAAVQAHAYAQGNEIHLGPGQEKHLAHELGHYPQKVDGSVEPTTVVNGQPVNDDVNLEREADEIAARITR